MSSIEASFVVPAFNEEALIGKCLSAIFAEVEASGVAAEVIVADNGSTDKTAAIVRSFPGAKLVEESVRGVVAARRAGHLAATGNFIAHIDADVILPPGWLAVALGEFKSDPALVCVSGPCKFYDLSAFKRFLIAAYFGVAYSLYIVIRYVLRCGSMVQGGNFMIRAGALEKVGGFSSKYQFYGEDADIALRLSKVGKVKFTLAMWCYSSGRRMAAEGVAAVGLRYALNYVWAIFVKRPFTAQWKDHRT